MHDEVDEIPTSAALAEATRHWLYDQTRRGLMRSWLAESEGKIVGAVSVRIRDSSPREHDLTGKEAYVHNLFVEREYRQHGIGRALMRALLDWCTANGYPRIALRATSMGRPLYEALGFTDDRAQMVFRGKN